MRLKVFPSIVSFVFVLLLASLACATAQPTLTVTNTPQPTVTETATPTRMPRPSRTPRPTRTPNLAATQRVEELNAQVKSFYDKGYLTTIEGKFTELDDFRYDWAQLG